MHFYFFRKYLFLHFLLLSCCFILISFDSLYFCLTSLHKSSLCFLLVQCFVLFFSFFSFFIYFPCFCPFLYFWFLWGEVEEREGMFIQWPAFTSFNETDWHLNNVCRYLINKDATSEHSEEVSKFLQLVSISVGHTFFWWAIYLLCSY